MSSLLYRRDGQVAPFMIAIIVVLIMAIMVTVNIGKVGITKTNTANAADAGALAGASTMANGLTSIGDLSDAMLADYLTAQATFIFCQICWVGWVIYAAHVASQAALFAVAWSNGRQTCVGAKTAAKQLAFSNAGIDEAKPRNLGESYEDWLKRDSNFQSWMKNEGYESSNQYTWTEKQGKQNWVRVEVDGPADFILVPMPGVIWFRAGLPAPPECELPCCCNCYCGPLPTIAAIMMATNDQEHLVVTVTRFEPEADLGLWQMNYNQSGGSGISSHSEAQAYGGMLIPFGADYDSKLVEPNW